MSYPSDPNNPYAKQPEQPGGQQPGYGAPQPQAGLPSYGGAADQSHPMGAGYGAPTSMPGTVNAARIMLFVTGGLSAVGAVLMFVSAAAIGTLSDNPELQDNADFEMLSGLGAGVLGLVGAVYLGLAVAGIVLGAKFTKGGSGVRTGTIVWGALVIIMGLLGIPVGLVFTIIGILVIVFVAKSDGKAWFGRPRY